MFFVNVLINLVCCCYLQADDLFYTPKDHPEDWILAKLWVRCADFHYQYIIAHLLRCHFVMEPFAISTMRHLSASHPVFKLLKPHFRYAPTLF